MYVYKCMWQSVCLCLAGGGGPSTELPLSQPPQPTPPSSATNTLRTNSCPGTPEMQRRREEAVKRLAAKVQSLANTVPQHLGEISVSMEKTKIVSRILKGYIDNTFM